MPGQGSREFWGRINMIFRMRKGGRKTLEYESVQPGHPETSSREPQSLPSCQRVATHLMSRNSERWFDELTMTPAMTMSGCRVRRSRSRLVTIGCTIRVRCCGRGRPRRRKGIPVVGWRASRRSDPVEHRRGTFMDFNFFNPINPTKSD
jgi:hypothetical protein